MIANNIYCSRFPRFFKLNRTGTGSYITFINKNSKQKVIRNIIKKLLSSKTDFCKDHEVEQFLNIRM